MDLIIVLVSIDVIASKFLDSYITSTRLEAFRRKRNPLYTKLLQKMGMENDIWLSMFFTVLLVGLGVYFLNAYFAVASFQLLYVFTCLFTTVLNLGAAHSNYFGRQNFITEKLLQVQKVRA